MIIRIRNVASQYIMILTCKLILNMYPALGQIGLEEGNTIYKTFAYLDIKN